MARVEVMCALLVNLSFCSGAIEDIQAVCPLKEVVAIIGDDVLLPCYTNPEINLSGSTLDWKRPDKEEIVYVYRNQKDEPQMEKYADQMKVDHSVLQWGNLSLLIFSVGPSDSGLYESYIPDHKASCEVQLTVVNRTSEDASTVSAWTRPTDPSRADAASLSDGAMASIIAAAAIVVVAVGCFAAALMIRRRRSRDSPI